MQIFVIFVVQTAIEVAYYAYIIIVAMVMASEARKELRYVTFVKISIYRLRACALKEFIRPTPF